MTIKTVHGSRLCLSYLGSNSIMTSHFHSVGTFSVHYFYRAMHFSAKRGIAIVCCPSVRLSVTLRYVFHTGWNTSKIISRPNSLRPLLWLTPTWAIWCYGNTPKFRVKER